MGPNTYGLGFRNFCLWQDIADIHTNSFSEQTRRPVNTPADNEQQFLASGYQPSLI